MTCLLRLVGAVIMMLGLGLVWSALSGDLITIIPLPIQLVLGIIITLGSMVIAWTVPHLKEGGKTTHGPDPRLDHLLKKWEDKEP